MSTTFNLFDLSQQQLCELARHYRDHLEVLIAANNTLVTRLQEVEGIPDAAGIHLHNWSEFQQRVALKSIESVESIVSTTGQKLN